MVSFKRDKPKTGADKAQIDTVGDNEQYPYGLRLSVHAQEIKKLGIDINKVSIKQKVKVIAEGEIVSISMNKTDHPTDEYRQSIDIQLTSGEIDMGQEKSQKYNGYKSQADGIGGMA